MKFKWVKHQVHSSIGAPEFVTVNYHGDILFGVKAKKQIIKDTKFAEIYFHYESNENIKCLGFGFFEYKTESSKIMQIRKSQVVIRTGHELAKKVGITEGTAKRFVIKHDDENKVWYIDLSQGQFLDTSNYRRGSK